LVATIPLCHVSRIEEASAKLSREAHAKRHDNDVSESGSPPVINRPLDFRSTRGWIITKDVAILFSGDVNMVAIAAKTHRSLPHSGAERFA